MRHDPDHFETLFATTEDPWRFRSRWYEARKRALTLACLPAQRYAHGYEPGCANGELSAALAERCDRLLISDGVPAAVKIARARTAIFDNVETAQLWVPHQWPDETFDLIVISELAYYLAAVDLDALIAKMKTGLTASGTVLACHWRRPIEGCALDGDQVQDRIGAGLALPRVLQVQDADLRLEVWCADSRSVAEREGLT